MKACAGCVQCAGCPFFMRLCLDSLALLKCLQATQGRQAESMKRNGGGNAKAPRRKAVPEVPDRFHGTQVRNEYIMAETMANW